MDSETKETFVGEPLVPVPATADASAMARGAPGLPARFTWRGTEYRVLRILESWKTVGPCRSGSPEVYVRRHWHRIETDPAAVLTVYCDRQTRRGGRPKARWWVYSESVPPEEANPADNGKER